MSPSNKGLIDSRANWELRMGGYGGVKSKKNIYHILLGVGSRGGFCIKNTRWMCKFKFK